jgi:squalene synthase HpnC
MDNRNVSVGHYENFPVASVLCPAALRPAVKAIYVFARTADDLADEGHVSPPQRLLDLDAFQADLLAVARGSEPSSRWGGVFATLVPVLQQYALPLEPLTDLLSAFRQDVVTHRYGQRSELLDYCRRSANPVGRLLLHLYGIDSPQALRRSDDICTALQLANFWQDFGIDARRGRIYVPAADVERHGVTMRALLEDAGDAAARALFADLVGWARFLMQRGAPLVHTVPGRAGWELRLVVQGGLRILEKIDAADVTTLHQRPVLRWFDAPILLWRAWRMRPCAPLASRQTI